MSVPNFNDDSPFHAGEKIIQSRAGKREAMEVFGRRAIRSFMPDQHREFYQQLPFLVVGSVDDNGAPWASFLSGTPGFTQSPTPTSLVLNGYPVDGDPVVDSLSVVGRPLGILGIEIPTRRRNRVNARVSSIEEGVELTVDQSFGNCPQYIQTRDITFIRDTAQSSDTQSVIEFNRLDGDARAAIEQSDTFFVSSYINSDQRPDIEGVDVSHRGGMPGFVNVKVKGEADTLTIPDYSGNFHFNTLGNFLINPKAGLVFPNFETGDLLMLTGHVEILWDDHPEVKAFKGAERGWRFTVEKGKWLKDALPFRATFGEYSPNSKITGNWDDANAVLEAEEHRHNWQPLKLTKVEDESSSVKSFYFEHAHGKALLPYKAGQFLPLRLQLDISSKKRVRTYSLSSAPNEDYYRISVKKEDKGLVSQYLHDHLAVGDVIKARAPTGDFSIDAAEGRPAVLLAAGIGITPMISMAKHVAFEGVRTRVTRRLTILHASRTADERAFSRDFRQLECNSSGAIKYHSFLSKSVATDTLMLGSNSDNGGRLTVDVLRQILGLDDYDFFLCGPNGFMQSMYDALIELGVNDHRIFAEAFGPAALNRVSDSTEPEPEPELIGRKEITEVENAVVTFTQSGFEQRWNAADGSILELAEEHDLSPDFGCRNGACGACSVKLTSGDVSYRSKPSFNIEPGSALICCAVPATELLEIEL